MDTHIRMISKAVTWQIAGFLSMTLIGYLFTGSFVTGGGIALFGTLTGFVAYFLHEILWSKISWGRGGG